MRSPGWRATLRSKGKDAVISSFFFRTLLAAIAVAAAELVAFGPG